MNGFVTYGATLLKCLHFNSFKSLVNGTFRIEEVNEDSIQTAQDRTFRMSEIGLVRDVLSEARN